MRNSMSKKIVAGLSALAVSAALGLTATPADAQFRHGGFGGGFGGFHGGMGGFRGGGWGGGWHGGGWRNAGWGYGGWNGCRWGGCGYNGWGWGLATGALLGAAATYPYYGNDYGADSSYGSDNGCWVRRRVWDARGHYLGRQLINICY